MTSIRRSLALSFIERYLLMAIALFGSILVARLLTPEEIGIYSVSLALIGIAQVVRDFGLGNFLIQERDLTDAHIRTAFGFALFIGFTLFGLVFLAAPAIADFYANDRLLQTLRISSLNFLVLPFCSISLSLLRREMAFNRLIKVNLIAASVGFITTISLAYAGCGPNSMAIGGVTSNLVTGMGAWFVRTDRKFLLPGISEWRKVLNFGGQSSLAAIVTTIAMDINDLAVGKILGFAPVAIISRAQGLMNLFHRDLMTAVRSVAFPAFSKAHRAGENLEVRYIASVTNVTVIAWPFYGFAALYALELIRLLFGPQWDEAVPLVPWFCLAGAVAATSNLILNAIMATGRIDLVTKSELFYQPLRAALIVAAAVLFESIWACTIAFAIALIAHTPYIYAFKSRCIPNDYRLLLSQLWSSAKVTFAALSGPVILVIYEGLGRHEPMGIMLILTAALVCGLSWLMALILFKHPLTADPLFQRLVAGLPRFA